MAEKEGYDITYIAKGAGVKPPTARALLREHKVKRPQKAWVFEKKADADAVIKKIKSTSKPAARKTKKAA